MLVLLLVLLLLLLLPRACAALFAACGGQAVLPMQSPIKALYASDLDQALQVRPRCEAAYSIRQGQTAALRSFSECMHSLSARFL
jgi:hypothetical protein